MNKYDPLLKGAANRYFLDAKNHGHLNEYLLGTTPGFLYGTTRAGIDKLRYPEGLPPERPPHVAKDTAAWRKLRSWMPADPWTGYPDSYRHTKEFRRLREAQPSGPDPWAKHEFWARKHYAQWRREPPAARRPRGTPERPASPRGMGDAIRRERRDEPPLPQRARAFAPALHNAKLFSAAATPLASLKPLSDLVNDIHRHAEHAAPLAAFVKKMKPPPIAVPPEPLQPFTGPEPLKPRVPPLPRPTPPNLARDLAALRDAVQPPTPPTLDIDSPTAGPPRPQPLPRREPASGPAIAHTRAGNTYHITIQKIADKIEAGTVDEKSLMKLLRYIVETELPT